MAALCLDDLRTHQVSIYLVARQTYQILMQFLSLSFYKLSFAVKFISVVKVPKSYTSTPCKLSHCNFKRFLSRIKDHCL